MVRRTQPRKSKKNKVLRAKPSKKNKSYYVAEGGHGLKNRAKLLGARILEIAENDPERFIDGIERAAKGVEAFYTFCQTNPAEAKRTLTNAAIAAAAKVAKQKLERD